MATPFGPRLIGEAEKTLNALLDKFLEDTALSEPQWVTLRVADALDGTVDAAGLAAAVADQAHFVDASDLVAELTSRSLLADGQPTPAGRELISTVQARITTATAPIFNDLAADDVEATTRVLNEVITRAR